MVETTHGIVVGLAFWVLRRVPVVSLVARLVEWAYFSVSGVVFKSVRRGVTAVAPAADVFSPHGRVEAAVRSALNGSHGDTLAAMRSPLATEMGFYAGGRPVPLTPEGLRSVVPPATGRICAFVHGICMDESAWQWGAKRGEPTRPYGDRLHDALGYAPLYVRYNSGLPVAENGRALAALLQALVDAYPVQDLVLVGHSMGGLLAHHACSAAVEDGLGWMHCTRMVITLGSPFRGSPVAKAGYVATEALHRFRVTSALGALADARSVGVKDLRFDQFPSGGAAGFGPAVPSVSYRYIGGRLLSRRSGLAGRVLGDGLVPEVSAAPLELRAEGAAARFGGVGHLRLLNDPRVYAQIEQWLREPRHGGAENQAPSAPAPRR